MLFQVEEIVTWRDWTHIGLPALCTVRSRKHYAGPMGVSAGIGIVFAVFGGCLAGLSAVRPSESRLLWARNAVFRYSAVPEKRGG